MTTGTTPENTIRTQELLAQEGLESIGQKLFNTIFIELSGNPKSARRWIWELLQNAKDVIVANGKIEINLTDSSVEFSHNGSPFQHSHLLAILSQRSTKSPSYTDDEKQIFYENLFSEQGVIEEEAKRFLNTSGRFGTGFMTTYLLSKKVFLNGVYSSAGVIKTFNISLDREASTNDEMKDKVKLSFSSFTELEQSNSGANIITNYLEGVNCDTKFIYHFDEEGKIVAEEGIRDLHNAIPYVLSFVKKLRTISINEYGKVTVYKLKTARKVDNLTIEKIEKETPDGVEIVEIATLSEKHDSLTVAVPIKNIEGDKYAILPSNENTPRQFISFPLVGSEAFPFPVIINSPLFNPDDSRSQVYLNLSTSHAFDKKVNLNRKLFEKTVTLHNQLLSTASKNNWNSLHFLAKTDLPKDVQDDWYGDSVQREIRKNILDAEIVVTEDGSRIKPKDAKFPIHGESKLEEFWSLCKFLCGGKIPRKDDVEIWKNIIQANTESWLGTDFNLSLERLLLLIQNSNSFKNFNETYFKDEALAFEALNKIIQFTEDEEKELLNRKEKPLMVFPNQANDSPFTEKQKLSRDVNVPKYLKDVLKTTGDDWYNKLVRDEIKVFERESKLTVKFVSDKIREQIEKYFGNKLTVEEKLLLDNGLFELSCFATEMNKSAIEILHRILKQFFPSLTESVQTVIGSEDFDWKPFQIWATRTILKKVASFETLDKVSQQIINRSYPEIKDEYSKDEEEIMFTVDSAINEIIQYVFSFDKNLLTEYAVIPNQLNKLCKHGSQIFNDAAIPKELKKIMTDFGKDCRGSLLHNGVSITLPGEARNLKWICGQLDDIAIKEQDNPELKQPIRELDKWIAQKKGSITGLDELFKSFYRKRSGIVLNTYSIEERNQFDEIQQSGMGSDLAAMIKAGATAATIKEVANVLESNPELDSEKMKGIADLLKHHPELTSDKIEQMVELSKGWNPELKYSPDEEQKRINFENGWKGEAFVYKELLRKNFSVDWRNKSEQDNANSVIDFEGEKHFITERFDKYDLVAKNNQGKTFYIQVKSTTTDISDSDQIAMPISIREWNFVFETKDNDAYYLARVFNVNSNPISYFIKLEKPEEL